MNLFMPYEDITKSVQALDDKRLNKQILECYQILQVAIGRSHGYENHPVVKHYKNYADFVFTYAIECCKEWRCRFNQIPAIHASFSVIAVFDDVKIIDEVPILLYAEYPATDPRCIRETDTDKVTQLFRDKLIRKWKQDIENGRPPKWTKREKPSFLEE